MGGAAIVAAALQQRVLKLAVKKKKNLFSAQKPITKMNKHVNKVRKATGRAKAITAGRQQNKVDTLNKWHVLNDILLKQGKKFIIL